MGICPPLVRGEIKLINIDPAATAVNIKDLNAETLPPPIAEPPIIMTHAEGITKVSGLVTGANCSRELCKPNIPARALLGLH